MIEEYYRDTVTKSVHFAGKNEEILTGTEAWNKFLLNIIHYSMQVVTSHQIAHSCSVPTL